MAARFSVSGVDFEGTFQRHAPFYGFATMTASGPRWTGRVELIESKLMEPLHWREPCRVFVNSMSDPFHEALPDDAIDRVFAVMALCPQHTFMVLTKRAKRMWEYVEDVKQEPEDIRDRIDSAAEEFGACHANLDDTRWPLPNVWLGVSVEDQKNKDRIDMLRDTPAAIRFLSLEPLLEDLGQLNLESIDWAIAGGESGPGARPMHPDWARRVRDQCQAAGVPYFFKQWGEWRPKSHGNGKGDWGTLTGAGEWFHFATPWNGHDDDGNGEAVMVRVGKKAAGRLLDGREHNNMPEVRK